MASDIAIGEQFLWVSNQRLRTLVEFVVEVGNDTLDGDAEREYVGRLGKWIAEEYWSGQSFDLDERFPTIDEKKFWARCFYDLGRRIFVREIGNQEIDYWQCGAIGEAYITARMLCHAIQKETGDSWFPSTEDAKRHNEHLDRLNIQN